MGPASICGGIQWGAIGPPWPGGGSREPFGRFPGAPLVTFPAQGKSRPRQGPRRSRRLHECKIIFLRVQALVLLRNPPLIRRSAPASPMGSQGTGRPCIRFLPAWPFVPRPRRAVCLPLGEGGSGVSRKPETDEGLSPRRADCFPPGKPGARAVISLRRCGEGHPEKQTTIAKQIQSRQADVPHPLLPRRAYVPFASAPAAPGVQGNAPAALFPRFLSRQRNRAAGGKPSGEKKHPVGEAV